MKLYKKSVIQGELTVGEAKVHVSRTESRKMSFSDSSKLYVKYEGNIYHVARFLSIAMGKVYTPYASRSERWKSSNTNNFFNRLPLPADPNGLKLQDRCLLKDKNYVVIRGILRILRHVGKFSTFAELSTKADDENVTYNFYIETSSSIKLVDGCFCKLEDDEKFENERGMLIYILKKKKKRAPANATVEKLFKLACK